MQSPVRVASLAVRGALSLYVQAAAASGVPSLCANSCHRLRTKHICGSSPVRVAAGKSQRVVCVRRLCSRSNTVQRVVRASRGSAAPGSQFVVVGGALAASAVGQHNPRMGKRAGVRFAAPVQQASHGHLFTQVRVSQVRANPSFKRTCNGVPLQALISFWALHGTPLQAA